MRQSGLGILDVTAIVLFVASCSLLLITVVETGGLESPKKLLQRRYTYLGSDHPRKWDIPPLERAQVSMENTVHFAYNTSLGDKEWEALLPSGGGMLHLGDTFEPYSISMFHQLRCLNIIRKAMIKFDDEGRSQKPDELTHHCMNYMRQMALCRSDLKLEHGRHWRRGLVVSDITRSSCKDWGAIYEAAEESHRRYQRRQVEKRG